MKTHLITGGSGFVGSKIAKILLNDKKNNIKIISLDLNVDKFTDDQRIEFIRHDILNFEELLKLTKNIDYIHHTAALVPLKKAGSKFRDVNVLGTKNVIEAAVLNKVKHVVHMSSSAVFGNVNKSDCPIKDTPEHLRPIEIYGQSKADAEKLIIKKINENNSFTKFSIIRPRTIVGIERLGIFEILFEWISEDINIYIIGNGKNIFQFVELEDLCNSSILASKKDKSGIYNVGAENFSTLEEALQNLLNHAKSKSKIKKIPHWLAIPTLYILDKLGFSPLGPWHYLTYHKDYYFDIEDTKRILNWQPKFDNDSTLSMAYDWYLKNKNYLSNDKSPHKSKLKQGILYLLKKLS